MHSLRNLWNGHKSLAAAFLGYYVLGCIATNVVVGGISGVFNFIVFGARLISSSVAAILFAAYCFVATVGVWRSASRYKGAQILPAFIKVVVIIMTPVFIVTTITMIDPRFPVGWWSGD